MMKQIRAYLKPSQNSTNANMGNLLAEEGIIVKGTKKENQALKSLFGIVKHDLRGPVNSIAQLLLAMDVEESIENKEPIKKLRGEVKELLESINILCETAESGLGSKKQGDLREFLAGAKEGMEKSLLSIYEKLEIYEASLPDGGAEDLEGWKSNVAISVRRIPDIINYVERLFAIGSEMAGAEEYAPKITEVKPVVERAASLVRGSAEGKGVSLAIGNTAECSFFGCENRLTLVLKNLLENAVKFTPKGGTVEVSAVNDLGTVRIAVRDSGIGLDDAAIRRIKGNLFGKNTSRTDTEGKSSTGLGLGFANAFIMEMGGRMEIESAVGAGSKFTLILPSEKPLPESPAIGEPI